MAIVYVLKRQNLTLGMSLNREVLVAFAIKKAEEWAVQERKLSKHHGTNMEYTVLVVDNISFRVESNRVGDDFKQMPYNSLIFPRELLE